MNPDETHPIESEPLTPVADGPRDLAVASTADSGRLDPTAEYRSKSEAGAVISDRYTLLEKIGEGGMGEVWVASQTEPVRRRVAVKLIKAGMDSRAVLRRFEQERQALAMMDHPNIARVLDAGLTPTGQPFFVMELVDGRELTRFCDEKKLTPRERLGLFVPICKAVQHAHQKGIIHRDLKPANILVTIVDGRPVPKVIDFGVAKATAGKLTDESMGTQFGTVVGTLEYMSPEQAAFSGDNIDTRSDIYSLGVILYELLTGLRPIDSRRLKQAAMTEMIRQIREVEPAKPSTRLSTDEALPSLAALRRTEPRKLTTMLHGELDWVVMKCLEKDRDRRYETANALARDVQRFLDDEVVEARPPSARYRLGKFLRRHRAQAIAAGLVLLALVAGIVGTTAGMMRARRAELAARSAESAAKAALLAEAKAGRDAIRALDEVAGPILEEYVVRMPKRTAEQSAFLDRLIERYRQFSRTAGDTVEAKASSAAAALRLGSLHVDMERRTDARPYLQAAVASLEALVAERPADPEFREQLARACLQLAFCSERTIDESARLADRSKEIRVGLLRESPGDPKRRHAVADCCEYLGFARAIQKRFDDAWAELVEGEGIAKALIEGDPDNYRYQFLQVNIDKFYARVRLMQGRPAEAEPLYVKSLERNARLTERYPNVPLLWNTLRRTYNMTGETYATLGRRQKVAEVVVKRAEVSRRMNALFPGVEAYEKEHDEDMAGQFMALRALGRPGEGLEALKVHESGLIKALGADHPRCRAWRASENEVLVANCRQMIAEGDGTGTLRILEHLKGRLPAQAPDGVPDEHDLSDLMGRAHRLCGRPGDAVAVLEEHRKRPHADTQALRAHNANILLVLAGAYIDLGRGDEAASRLEACLETLRSDPPLRRLAPDVLDLFWKADRPADADKILPEILGWSKPTPAEDMRDVVTRFRLARLLLRRKKYAEVEPLLIDSYEAAKAEVKSKPAMSGPLTEALQRLVQINEETGKPDQAGRWRKELEALKTAPKSP